MHIWIGGAGLLGGSNPGDLAPAVLTQTRGTALLVLLKLWSYSPLKG